jgi:hypothetical protein
MYVDGSLWYTSITGMRYRQRGEMATGHAPVGFYRRCRADHDYTWRRQGPGDSCGACPGQTCCLAHLVRYRMRAAATAPTSSPPQHGASAFGRGLLNNLLNPKIGVFYSAFLPPFIAPGQPVFVMSVALAAIHAVLGITWLLFYATIMTKAGDLFRRPRIRRALECVTGIVLVGLGLRRASALRAIISIANPERSRGIGTRCARQ